MSSYKFYLQRDSETQFVLSHFDGDCRLYRFAKERQEERKRVRQSRIPLQELYANLHGHYQLFPNWFRVRDATLGYCSRLLLESNINVHSNSWKSVDVPVLISSWLDMHDVFSEVLKAFDGQILGMNISCVYGFDTTNVPHKMVLMKQDDGTGGDFCQALKHQERYLSPLTIYEVVGCKFEKGRSVIITKGVMQHTRYLHKSFERYQFHPSLPRADVPMRVCYGIKPETVSTIVLYTKFSTKIVLRPAWRRDCNFISKQQVVDTVCYSIVQAGLQN